MKKAEEYAKAIRAALAYSGRTQADLAERMGISADTLGRKLKHPQALTLLDLIQADELIKWTNFMGGEA